MRSRHKSKKNSTNKEPVNFIHILILIAYGYIAVITPNLKTYDSNGPKFFAFSVLNLAVWSYIFYRRKSYFSEFSFTGLFKSKTGFAYLLLLVVSMVSVTKAINVAGSIIPFFKMLTTFAATMAIAVIMIADKNSTKYLAIGLTILLAFDSLRVFSETQQFIKGDLGNISLIKAGYSNKNILAAALFIKIPFALWLFTYFNGWLKNFGLFALLIGVTSILFMSARAFYIGLIALSLGYLTFLLVRYFQLKNLIYLKKSALYISVIITAFIIFTIVESNYYPKNARGKNRGFTERLATVTAQDGGGGRLKYWKITTKMVKNNPLLGIGLGNWKIHVVDEENKFRGSFGSFYKVHNDFLEVTAESGIIAGLAYISLFIMAYLYFAFALFKQKSESNIKLMFIPAFGLLAYTFDAFFNFPHDRPEIQSLFAIFIGTTIFYSIKVQGSADNENANVGLVKIKNFIPKNSQALNVIFFIAIILSTYFLFLNFKALKLQRIWRDERLTGKIQVNSDYFINNFPFVPNIGADGGEPVKMMIAKKLHTEKKYKEMQYYIQNNYPNPFDSKIEFFLGISHLNLNNTDSALYYIEKAYYKKPYAYLYARQYCNLLETKGRQTEAIDVMDDFIAKDKKERDAWLYSASLNFKSGNKAKTEQIIDSAFVYFPKDTTIIRLKNLYSNNQ